MSVNLLDLAKGYLTDSVMDQASSFLGEDKRAAQSGFSHALPALLGGMMNKAGQRNEAQELFNMVSKPEMGGGLLNNLGDLFSSSQQSTETMNLGGTLLKGLMGDKLGSVVDLISSASGMKSGSTSSLLKLALPMLMSVIGKKVKNDGLGLDGFMDLLSGQEKHVQAAAPSGFMDKLLGAFGVASLGGVVNSATNSIKHTADKATTTVKDTTTRVASTVAGDNHNNDDKKGGGGFGRILPLLLILGLLALAAYLLTRGCDNDVTDSMKDGADKIGDTVKDGADTVGDAMASGADAIYSGGKDLVGKTVEGFENLGKFTKRTLDDGTELFVPEKGAEAGLINFIDSDNDVPDTPTADDWFNLRRVLFETGSANLDARSMNQIDNLVAVMSAYPDVHLKIGGYTDSDGDEAANKTLSNARANAVMQAMVDKGVDASRLAAEGYGEEFPVASNDTEEGKQQNRRVAARVTQK